MRFLMYGHSQVSLCNMLWSLAINEQLNHAMGEFDMSNYYVYKHNPHS